MSWSFHVHNGDLNMSGPGGFSVVAGSQKLIQDLKHWILEPQGTDPMHPDYGSAFDAGRRVNGTVVEGMIGEPLIRERLLDVESELRRILAAYQGQQLLRLQRDSAQFSGKNTFAPNEILQSVSNIAVDQLADRIICNVALRTHNNQDISLIQPVG